MRSGAAENSPQRLKPLPIVRDAARLKAAHFQNRIPRVHLAFALLVVMQQRHHVVAFQLFTAMQEIEFDHKAEANNLRS